MTESYKLIKENGDELEFNIGNYDLMSLNNFGNPQIDYTTQQTYYQDGALVTNFVAAPRVINVPLIGQIENIQNRTQFWQLRRDILNFLSPVNGPMRLQITLDDHTVYELTNVYATNGLSMEGNTFTPTRNDGRIDEPLRLTAYDPIWRISPIKTTGSIVPVISEELVFPIEFPISFGAAGATFNETINYEGSWRSYPKITIQGPYNTAVLTNVGTGAQISLIRSITTSETRVIDLTNPVSGFNVVDQSGVNKIGEINLTTNFTQFYFAPNQTNVITAVLNGGSLANTRLTIEWYTKFLGI